MSSGILDINVLRAPAHEENMFTEYKVNISMCTGSVFSLYIYIYIFNSPSLLTTYRPRKPVAPNTVAAIPLEEERPPFPLGMRAWCSFLCWTVETEAADNAAEEQLPVESILTQKAFSHC